MRNFLVFGLGAASVAAVVACFTGCAEEGGDPASDLVADSGTLSVDGGSATTDGGASGSDAGLVSFTVSASVVGLQGTGLVLREKSGAELTVAPQGGATQKVTFPAKLPAGTTYEVTVKTQPSGPPQSCVVTGGTGTIVAGNVESITVNCTTLYTVGGTVSGLAGKDLILENNGAADSVTINANGQFAFAKPLTSGAAYAVTVKQNPTNKWQTCTVVAGDGGAAASGTIGTSNVTNVNVVCTTNTYDVAVAVTGLAGTGLVFQNKGADDLAFDANGTKTFATKVESGAEYDVVASVQPTSPWQTCSVANGKANMAGANVTLNATCTTNKYKIKGTLSGLQGNGLVLQNNAGDDLTLNAVQNGAFTFATDVASGGAYAVTVKTQPNGVANEECSVAKGSGTVAGADVTDVEVTCTTRTKVMLCGGSSRPISQFFPAGTNLTAVSSCTPDDATRAILVSRGGVSQFNGPALKAYAEAGGIVLTETFSSDEVYNAIFGTNVTEQGFTGACHDVAPTVVQLTAADPVWAGTAFQAIPFGETGCGNNVASYPGLVPLAGYSAAQVAIGYRDAGLGRVYVTEFDWQDGENYPYAYTNGLMGYFITHVR